MGNNASEAGSYSSYAPTRSAFKRQRKKEAKYQPRSLFGTDNIEVLD